MRTEQIVARVEQATGLADDEQQLTQLRTVGSKAGPVGHPAEVADGVEALPPPGSRSPTT